MRMFYICCAPAQLHGMYPGVSSYGMEADPPRFLYLMLSDDWLLWYRYFINHEKFCDLDLEVDEEVGVGIKQRNILDQYLTSGIQRFKRYQF